MSARSPACACCCLDRAVGVVDAADAADPGAGRRLTHRAACCGSVQSDAATGHHLHACWAVADRESVGCGRFATSYIFPSSFALRLIVFCLGLNYSDYAVACVTKTVAIRNRWDICPTYRSLLLAIRIFRIFRTPRVLPEPVRCRPWPSRATWQAERGPPRALRVPSGQTAPSS